MEPSLESRPGALVHLADDVAVQRHFDVYNYRLLRALATVFAAVAVAAALWRLAQGQVLDLWLPVANLLALRLVFWASDRALRTGRFQALVAAYMVAQLAVLPFYLPDLELGLRVTGFVAPVALLGFRLRVLVSLSLYTLVGLATLGGDAARVWNADAPPPWIPGLQIAVTLTCLFLNMSLMRGSYRRFMREFQVEASRSRDRQRMREELDYARQIQLRMLPRGDPKLEHLDVSGISLPATEVGGDYFEYFRPSSQRLCIAIGDVAGHGVASGLLLSGIRSCLHLLRDEPLSPREILDRLNRMVGETTSRRMFITLLYADFDWEAARVRLSSAGHPPLLKVATDGEVTELGLGALPLGTRLRASYQEEGAHFGAGDVMLLYTDGLTEILSPSGEVYGTERLASRLREHRRKPSREIREALLADLWNFKGDAEQLDDLTLVVVKARPRVAGDETGRPSDDPEPP
ncbi:MAG: PP2C family protein-serine/threonine phosphatase [Thermoanaerobaculia bacterium]|nr:PP2C family protein-serine/threonine phosphatase [Thermoanaerobaculia bacterium]